MEKKASYLSQLRFDPKLATSFISKYLRNPRLVLLLLTLILAVGITSFLQIPRVLNPSINIPIVVVSDVLPGASPNDVEQLVTIPLEDAVRGVSNVKTVTSTAQDSVTTIQAEFNSGVDPEKARTDVQAAVDGVTLPTDAQTPKVIKVDFQNVPVWTFILTTKGDAASLIQFGNTLKDKLEELPSVDKANTNGIEADEIQVLIKPSAITQYKISPIQLSSAIKAAVGSYPAGSVKTDVSTFSLSIDPNVASIDQLRNLRITLNGTPVALSDIAVISQRSKPDQFPSYYASSTTPKQRAITFSVYKKSTAQIEQTSLDSQKLVNDLLKQYNGQFEVASEINTAEEISTQFQDLVRDLMLTIVLIMIILFVFLGIRQSLVASLSVPVTFLITFTIMNITHIDFSFIAFFSLLLALGLLVDDTIVVISAMTSYFKTGKFTPLESALLVWRDFITPIFTTTITTVWAFLPLLLASGIIGEFIKPIPIVASTTLLGSFFVAMFITLPLLIIIFSAYIPYRVKIFGRVFGLIAVVGLCIALLPKATLFIPQLIVLILFFLVTYRVREVLARSLAKRWKRVYTRDRKARFSRIFDNGLIPFALIDARYHTILDRILSTKTGRRNAIIAVIVFFIFSFLLVPLGFVQNEFFPKSDADYLYVTEELPAGSNTDLAKIELDKNINKLRSITGVKYVAADIGQSAPTGGFGGGGGGANNILYTLRLTEKGHRRSSIDIAKDIRDSYQNYQAGKITVVEESGGPPAGSDLQIKLYGDDLHTLDQYADKLIAHLNQQAGVTTPDKSIKPGSGKIVFVPDQQKLADNNISIDQLGLWLRTYASGFTLDSVKFDNKDRDINLRMYTEMPSPETISSIVIPGQGQNGVELPLASLGSLKTEANPTLITREDGKRTISVSASVQKGYNVPQENSQLEKFADSLGLPPGYSWKTGGVNDENNKSVQSILQAMLLSFFLILVTMVLQFSSFRKAIIVMLVIPLSISGVFIIFALSGTPLSFPALIGVLALFGIVVKNSILIVDKIDQNEKAGLPFKDAITDAATSRLEPIALTSVAAIAGLIPITLSDPLWRGLGGAIIAGLTFSGTIMLFFIPVVYWYWFHNSDEAKGIRK